LIAHLIFYYIFTTRLYNILIVKFDMNTRTLFLSNNHNASLSQNTVSNSQKSKKESKQQPEPKKKLRKPPLHWPQNIQDIKITQKEKSLIDRYIASSADAIFNRVNITAFRRSDGILPRTIVYTPTSKRLFLKLGQKNKMPLIGSGGERVVKHGYDLTRGKLVAYKQINSREALVYQKIQNSKCAGLPKIHALFQTKPLHLNEPKFLVIEKKYRDSLHELKQTTKNLSAAVIQQIMKDLLQGLKHLHGLSIDTKEEAQSVKISLFHGDIKPRNILYSYSKDQKIHSVLEDFGFSGRVAGISGTAGFMPPELLKEYHQIKNSNTGDTQKLFSKMNATYGQPKDMWDMGLVLSFLLRKEKRERSIPFDSILNNIIVKNDQRSLTESEIPPQEELNKEIENIIMTLSKADPDDIQRIALWDLAKKMLEYDPAKRIEVKEALSIIERFN
jgi:hypothetical protein